MTRKRLIVSAACFSVLLAVSFLMAAAVENPMDHADAGSVSERLFADVDALWSLPRLDPENVEPLIRMSFAVTSAPPPPAAQILTAAGDAGPYASAELRIPADSSIAADGMLILKLTPPFTVTLDEVQARYGEASNVLPPHPNAPPETPVYYEYEDGKMKGVLRFGIREERVVSVILDRFPR